MNQRDTLLMNHLGQFVSDHKKELIETVLQSRTRHMTVVLEDIHKSQNASAVIRTCECFGIQDIHIIEGRSSYKINPYVLRGARQWVNITTYSKGQQPGWHEKLKASGYKILATSVNQQASSIHEIDVSKKIAIVFGNDEEGVSPETLKIADGTVTIPMVGFTESLNISASVAICLNTWITSVRNANLAIGLSQEEKDHLKLDWYRTIVKRSDVIETEFLRSIH